MGRDDVRYDWQKRPRDHGVTGLYVEGPQETQCRIWDQIAAALTPADRRRRERNREAERIAREAALSRRATRRPAVRHLALLQPQAHVETTQPHPRAPKGLMVRASQVTP